MHMLLFSIALWKIRTYFEISAWNGSDVKGALNKNFSLTGCQLLGSYTWSFAVSHPRCESYACDFKMFI